MLAAVENVFPPVPADSAVAAGALLSAGGRVTAWGVFAITWLANLASASAVYGVARTIGRAFFQRPIGRRVLRREALRRLERLYERHGIWAIFLSRFIPGVRAVVPPFAGVANLGWARALIPVAVASAAWYGALTFVAATAVRNVDQLGQLAGRLHAGALVTAVMAAGVAGFLWWRQWRRQRSK